MKTILIVFKYALMLVGVAYLIMLVFLNFFSPGLSCTNYPMFNLPSPDGGHIATAFQEVCNDGKLKTVISLSGHLPASLVGQKTVIFSAESSVTSKMGEVKPLSFSAKWLASNRLQITIPDKNVIFLTKQSNVYGIDIVYVQVNSNY